MNRADAIKKLLEHYELRCEQRAIELDGSSSRDDAVRYSELLTLVVGDLESKIAELKSGRIVDSHLQFKIFITIFPEAFEDPKPYELEQALEDIRDSGICEDDLDELNRRSGVENELQWFLRAKKAFIDRYERRIQVVKSLDFEEWVKAKCPR